MPAVDLFHCQYGQGVPVIFMHGYPLDHTIWLPLVPLLKMEVEMILPDLRGHGKSPHPAGVYSMHLMAHDVILLMDRLKISRAVIAGHSMGGYVALNIAQSFPHRLSGLVLVTTHCFSDTAEGIQNRLETADRVEKTGNVEFIADSMLPKLTDDLSLQACLKEVILSTNPKGIAAVLRGMAERRDTCEVISHLKAPCVIIAGGKDHLIPLPKMRQMSALMRKPRLEIIPSVGHMPMLEEPQTVARILLSFLQLIRDD
jgi:3-oxoadipate enol-lactonase